MSHPAIRVEGLWKEYSIGAQSLAGQTFRESLMASVQRPWQRLTGRGEAVQSDEHFWALKDVSFEVQPGEVVGIIGRNGAGKSTLLKILSRITAPTKGCVEIRGRVASLLEVGTGFHQELTGRENIRLNAAILGMSSAEVARKFDEIVDFSGVEKFIDTPVKRYSSGMQVRLAFAVAAHLEPEILIIDEVLAVGDAEFQKKCIGRISEIGTSGRTVLFVSHNLSAVSALCTAGIYLEKGLIVHRGTANEVLKEYSQGAASNGTFQRGDVIKTDLAVISANAEYDSDVPNQGAGVRVALTLLARKDIATSIDLRLKDSFGVPVGFGSIGALDSRDMISIEAGTRDLMIYLPAPRLAAGTYTMSIDLTLPGVAYYDRLEDCLTLSVEPTGTEVGVQPLKQEWGYGSTFFPMSVQCLQANFMNDNRT